MAGRTEGRSPVTVGALGILILLMVTVAAFYLSSLPLVGAGVTYSASFTEAAGLRKGAEVRVAGVKVGKVNSVELNDDNNRVIAKFQVNNAWIGDQTSASIQIKTVLGQKYLALEPNGSELADPKKLITRTTSPYDVIEAVSDVSRQVTNINTDQLATSFRTLSDSLSGTSSDLGPALDGLTRLSQTVSSRDQQVQTLLATTKDTSKLLADRNDEFQKLIAGAGGLLTELNNRQKSISQLLSSTTALSTTLTGIVRDNEKQIGPTLDSLKQVTALLNRQQNNLRDSINYLAPFYRLYSNVLGNGRWFNAAITNILPPGLPQGPLVGAPNTTRPPGKTKQLNNGGTEATG
ncbi:MlaD family protein [Williamsia sterculiae]|uniref:Phospholipid/cholesterol/gamma-HCH transport system substrate-binding protein n=1 Tax=Williamsia sterculiae TaxID=1344003 RepID=A0A1N7D452_9NOCA|nr:MlaD family protein [Williamsia sterculiae]SIR70524.1 phospholipid/cholesterol/gamma-HCH transport system substrate-binding protein [Williamsia sterculiae]